MNQICLSTNYLCYTITEEGQNLSFIDKEKGINHILPGPCANIVNIDRTEVAVVNALYSDGILRLIFADGTKAELLVQEHADFITFTIQSVSREDFLAIEFVNIYLKDNEQRDFCGTLIGMTLATRMKEHPGDNRILKASAYPHIGITSTARSDYPAKAAIIGAPRIVLREIERQVLDEIPDGEIPKSKKGGPYSDTAADAARGIYSMFTETVTMENIDEAVASLKKFQINQVNLHHFGHYTQGEFSCDKFYRRGIKDFKHIVERFHKEGILVGIHSYAFFLSTESAYLTPVPHKDIDTLREFTLQDSLDKEELTINVFESTEGVSSEEGYLLVNSPYLWIDDELVKFTEVKDGSFCIIERGAYGTIPAEHSAGTKVRQLKQFFYLPMARAGSELFYEIARNTAKLYNESGADLFYLDALDGSFVLEGDDYLWYHAIDFIRELFYHLDRDPVFDCCHNLNYTGSWFVRSRYGALDESLNSHRQYFDAHMKYNSETAIRMGITPEMGWVNLYPHEGDPDKWWQNEPMYKEDLEYLCAKAFASGSSLAFMESIRFCDKLPCTEEYLHILNKYASFRSRFTASKETGEYLRIARNGAYLQDDLLYRTKYCQAYLEHNREGFIVENPFEEQTPVLRIEALCAANDYDNSDGIILCDLSEQQPLRDMSFRYEQPINAQGRRGIGVWCYGDGSDAIVCISVRNLFANQKRAGEHYIRVNFTGWRYFAFYENQNGCIDSNEWSSSNMVYDTYYELQKFYGYYRARLNYERIDGVDIFVKGSENIRLKPILLLPHRKPVWHNPTVKFAKGEVKFLTDLQADTVLFFDGKNCVVTDKLGTVLERPQWVGTPFLPSGKSFVTMESDSEDTLVRARVTINMYGSVLQ